MQNNFQSLQLPNKCQTEDQIEQTKRNLEKSFQADLRIDPRDKQGNIKIRCLHERTKKCKFQVIYQKLKENSGFQLNQPNAMFIHSCNSCKYSAEEIIFNNHFRDFKYKMMDNSPVIIKIVSEQWEQKKYKAAKSGNSCISKGKQLAKLKPKNLIAELQNKQISLFNNIINNDHILYKKCKKLFDNYLKQINNKLNPKKSHKKTKKDSDNLDSPFDSSSPCSFTSLDSSPSNQGCSTQMYSQPQGFNINDEKTNTFDKYFLSEETQIVDRYLNLGEPQQKFVTDNNISMFQYDLQQYQDQDQNQNYQYPCSNNNQIFQRLKPKNFNL